MKYFWILALIIIPFSLGATETEDASINSVKRGRKSYKKTCSNKYKVSHSYVRRGNKKETVSRCIFRGGYPRRGDTVRIVEKNGKRYFLKLKR